MYTCGGVCACASGGLCTCMGGLCMCVGGSVHVWQLITNLRCLRKYTWSSDDPLPVTQIHSLFRQTSFCLVHQLKLGHSLIGEARLAVVDLWTLPRPSLRVMRRGRCGQCTGSSLVLLLEARAGKEEKKNCYYWWTVEGRRKNDN